jgi:hypothetical protein
MTAPRELADRAAAVCRRPLSAKALREELVALVRRAVPFGGYNFPLTDPVSRVGTSPLADVPGLSWPRLPALICSRYLTAPQIQYFQEVLLNFNGLSWPHVWVVPAIPAWAWA